MSAHENVVGGKPKRKEKAPDVEAAGTRNEKKHDKKKQKKHHDQISLDTENVKELGDGKMSAHENVVGGKPKRKEKAPDVEAAGTRNKKKHVKKKQKKHHDQMSLDTENVKELGTGKLLAHENVVGGKRKRKVKAPDVEAAGTRNEKKHVKKKQKKHHDQMSLDTENVKELGAGKMSAHENVGGKPKHKEKTPDVEAAGARKEKKHDKEKQKKHQDQMSLDTENVKEYRPARLKSFVGGNLKLKEKAPDEEVAGVRNKEKHKKHQVQMSLVTDNEKDLAAGSKGKESDAHQETYFDDFLGKEVPVIEVEGKRGGCAVCGKWDHYNYRCPCLKYFRKGTEIGVLYETVCRGCHRFGEVCCPKKGGYALLKECGYCYDIGHWEWEDCEECSRPKDKVYEKPEFLGDKEEEEEEDPESIIHPELIFYPPFGNGEEA